MIPSLQEKKMQLFLATSHRQGDAGNMPGFLNRKLLYICFSLILLQVLITEPYVLPNPEHTKPAVGVEALQISFTWWSCTLCVTFALGLTASF